MKKILIFLIVLGATTAVYSEDKYDALDDKVEVELKKEINISSGEYDVEIYDENGIKGAHVKLDIPSKNIKKDKDYSKEAEKAFKILQKNGVNKTHFFVESDVENGKDEIVYEKTEIK